VGSTSEQDRVNLVLHALADPTRRDIAALVLRQEHSVSDLARRYPMSFAAVQKHVAVLERASLVTKRERGRERLVSGRIEAVRDVARIFDQLETTWRNRLDRFRDVLTEPEPGLDPEPQADHPRQETLKTMKALTDEGAKR
jgi:DNA-binding transcriptional ArsR family regulator